MSVTETFDAGSTGPLLVSDAHLVAAALTNPAGLAGIYDRYADKLHDFCFGLLRDRDAAADCMQDTFTTAAAQLRQLREPDKLRPWLYAIARREALSRLRERNREQPADELPDNTNGQPDLAVLAARVELTDLISHAAGGLTERDRAVLELHYYHGLDGPDLAEALDVSPSNANTMVSRLRTTIERSLGALLVARQARSRAASCSALAEVLQGWDGTFTVLTRKRVSRHIDHCPACEQSRRRLVNPRALLGAIPVLVTAPAWLREPVLAHAATAASHTTAAGPAGAVAHSTWLPSAQSLDQLWRGKIAASTAGASLLVTAAVVTVPVISSLVDPGPGSSRSDAGAEANRARTSTVPARVHPIADVHLGPAEGLEPPRPARAPYVEGPSTVGSTDIPRTRRPDASDQVGDSMTTAPAAGGGSGGGTGGGGGLGGTVGGSSGGVGGTVSGPNDGVGSHGQGSQDLGSFPGNSAGGPTASGVGSGVVSESGGLGDGLGDGVSAVDAPGHQDLGGLEPAENPSY